LFSFEFAFINSIAKFIIKQKAIKKAIKSEEGFAKIPGRKRKSQVVKSDGEVAVVDRAKTNNITSQITKAKAGGKSF